MTSAERFYRVLLRAYPPSTRAEFGEDMVQLFLDQVRDADSRGARSVVVLRALVDTAVEAPRARRRRPRAVTAAGPALEVHGRSLRADLVAASAPLVATAAWCAVLNRLVSPLWDDRLSVLGVPAGVVVLAIAMALAAFGIFAARRPWGGDLRVALLALVAWCVPVPTVAFVTEIAGPLLIAYVALPAVLIALSRRRAVMLGLVTPLVAWLLIGPAIVLWAINLKV